MNIILVLQEFPFFKKRLLGRLQAATVRRFVIRER